MKSVLKFPSKTLFIFIAGIIHSVFAVYNVGFYHPDEHYQLIEFAELKTGKNGPSDLAWEYNAKVRSAIQPAIAFLIVTTLRFSNFLDNYEIIIIFRLLCSALSITIISFFIRAMDKTIDKKFKVAYYGLSFLLWFLPFINVRYSSENFAGLSFLIALIFLTKTGTTRNFLLVGIFLGISFLFRFQTAFMSMGLILWLIFVFKTELNNIFILLIGVLIMINLGVLVDWWFYGNFTYTFINYFFVNIVEDVASMFGISPWYYYLTEFLNYGFNSHINIGHRVDCFSDYVCLEECYGVDHNSIFNYSFSYPS